jgi:hypothetical protein
MFITERLLKGTLDGRPLDRNPQYALNSTFNWAKALALLCGSFISKKSAKQFYDEKSSNSSPRDEAINSAFEELVFSLHELAALTAMAEANSEATFYRSSIVAWYYAIYHGAKAMVCIQSQQSPEAHIPLANLWLDNLAKRELIMPPFHLFLDSLVEKSYIEALKNNGYGTKVTVNQVPNNREEANAAHLSYFKGCADWYQEREKKERIEPDLRKQLKLENFRTKEAKQFRDERLGKKKLGFLHMAYRFRGKANYRDSIYVALNSNIQQGISKQSIADEKTLFIQDLYYSARAFITMAGAFCFSKIDGTLRENFIKDFKENKTFIFDIDEVF